MARFRRGTMFLNRYVLLEAIGQGSVAVVYQAEDTLNSRQVAVKLLDPAFADDRRAQARLRHPAEIMAHLPDAGVPRVYEFGAAPLGDGSSLGYCVLELLTGEALDSRLARGPLPWLEAVKVAATVADVLTLAHAQSIALRVIGPSGVLLTADGAKIVDFDAAMTVAPAPAPAPEPEVPRSRRRRGAGAEASPAQRPERGAVAIANLAAEDVYALGALLDQMLGGTGPGAGLPAPLVDLCLRCLSEPLHRPDAATLSMELWGMLTPGPTVPVAGPEPADSPLSVPMNLRPAPGRHSAVAALESRAAVESAALARGALARAALDRPRRDLAPEQISYRVDTPLSPAAEAAAALGSGAAAMLGGRAAAARDTAAHANGTMRGNGTASLGSGVAAASFGGGVAAALGGGVAAALGDRAAAARDGGTAAGHANGAAGSAPAGRIAASRERDRATGPQQTPVGHAGHGGRHRRRLPAWTGPTGQASPLP